MSRLRIWTAPDGPAGAVVADVCVEWIARPGHPSSYGLLGGYLGATPSEPVAWPAGPYPQSLAGGTDRVEFGLPKEYIPAIADLAGQLVVTVAAHGQVGSSLLVFRRLASVLLGFLIDGVPDSEDDVWRAWDRT